MSSITSNTTATIWWTSANTAGTDSYYVYGLGQDSSGNACVRIQYMPAVQRFVNAAEAAEIERQKQEYLEVLRKRRAEQVRIERIEKAWDAMANDLRFSRCLLSWTQNLMREGGLEALDAKEKAVDIVRNKLPAIQAMGADL